jgi:hypothetical protein
MGREARQDVIKGLEIIRDLVGSAADVRLPSDDALEAATGKRTNELKDLIIRAPFTIDSAVKALDRVDGKRPPAGAQQQFKDSVIWEDCVAWAVTYDVHLVSNDHAFYEEKNKQRGLSRALISELDALGLSISLHGSLSELLRELGANADAGFNLEPVARAVYYRAMYLFSLQAAKLSYELGEVMSVRVEAFATQDASLLSVRFNILELGIGDDLGASVTGQCTYSMEDQVVTVLQLDGVIIRERTSEGFAERKIAFGNVITVLDASSEAKHEASVPIPGVNGEESFVYRRSEMFSDRQYGFG